MNTPAPSLLAQLAAELQPHVPFAQMAPEDLQAFVQAATAQYYAPGERICQPGDGPAPRLCFIRRGAVSARHGPAEDAPGGIHYEAGDLFPAAAVAGERAVQATYEAVEDTFCLEVPAGFARALAGRSAPFGDYLVRRVQQLLALSRRQLQARQSLQALAEHSMEAPLSQQPRKVPVACDRDTPLQQVLELMHQRQVGSVLVLGADGHADGILTRHDVLARVALPRPDPATPIHALMTTPVHTLDIASSAQDAALAMARLGVRHLPLTEHGRVVSVVSERDLFALQRLSVRQVGSALREAADLPALQAGAADIRRLAERLLTQGLAAHALTALLSHLNDLLTERIVRWCAQRHGLGLHGVCWLAFGSEGRSEQTVATDQDNGLVLADPLDERLRQAWLACAREVNDTLDACGYPLCKGGVMASQPDCCLSVSGWQDRFTRWMEQGAPEDLLNASIYFDLRPLAGELALADPLRHVVQHGAAALPRFCKQMADNSLRLKPALNWRGALDTDSDGPHAWLDLKLRGSAVFVDGARLLALRHGVPATGTRERLQALVTGGHLPAADGQAWIAAFEVLQMLRLRQQLGPDADPAQPNRVDVAALSAIDRRLLKDAMRQARALQQRLAMDFPG